MSSHRGKAMGKARARAVATRKIVAAKGSRPPLARVLANDARGVIKAVKTMPSKVAGAVKKAVKPAYVTKGGKKYKRTGRRGMTLVPAE